MRGKLRTFEPFNLPPNNLSMLNLLIKPCEIIIRYSKKAGPGNTPGSASVLIGVKMFGFAWKIGKTAAKTKNRRTHILSKHGSFYAKE